jgi:cation:H+ antiporter
MLVVGANLLVRGAVWVAVTMGMSRMSVGLTLVAMGTSMPELLVSFIAARTGHSEIAMANVIGSNTANVLLIIGLAAAIRAIQLSVKWLELGYMVLATALAGVSFVIEGGVSRLLSASMVLMLVVFCAQLLARERQGGRLAEDPHTRRTAGAWLLHLTLIGGGLALLCYGASWLVEGAVSIAHAWGMSEAVIGMTIIAVGTSLPELATSAVAAMQGQPEIAVGNVVGSNIFNVGGVLGIAGLLAPFPVDRDALGSLMIATVVSALALVFVLRLQRGVSRPTGIVFVLAYSAYATFEVVSHRPA